MICRPSLQRRIKRELLARCYSMFKHVSGSYAGVAPTPTPSEIPEAPPSQQLPAVRLRERSRSWPAQLHVTTPELRRWACQRSSSRPVRPSSAPGMESGMTYYS